MTLEYKILGQIYYGAEIIHHPAVSGIPGTPGNPYLGIPSTPGTPGVDAYDEAVIAPKVIYTVPTGKQTIITSIFVTNHDVVQRTYDLAVVPAGQTLSVKHHIRWDMPVKAADIDNINAKLTLNSGDKIYVFPSTVDKIGFTAFGVEQ